MSDTEIQLDHPLDPGAPEPANPGESADVGDPSVPASGDSLEARMARQRDVLEGARTERFPIPGYESVVEVELRMLGYRRSRKIGEKHERVRDTAVRDLYIAADSLLEATVAFYEVHGDEPDDTPTDGITWVKLARAAVSSLPENATPRQAILALLGDERLPYLADDWAKWMRSERGEVDEEQAAGFTTTP